MGEKCDIRLTDATVSKLQNFYRKAIADNVSEVDTMKTSILATFLRCKSTDAKPTHSKCPEGKLFWCFYNRAKTDRKVPGNHTSIKIKLREEVVAKLRQCTSALPQKKFFFAVFLAKPKIPMKFYTVVFGGNAPKMFLLQREKLILQ
ncbi:uncharacterized protein TNCV_1270871 [Trichonephila clavipes]|nr:uncharacterized protein TNCV_1270871 [Trichonephila clavipes]